MTEHLFRWYGWAMVPGELVLLQIAALDPARAARFYAGLFGWQCGGVSPAGVPFRTTGGLHGLFRSGDPSTAGPELYVAVADLALAVGRGVALGGSTLVRPGPARGGGRAAVLLDPEGNRIGLWEAGVATGEGELVFLANEAGRTVGPFGSGAPSPRH